MKRSWAGDQDCASLYRQQKFVQSAACFEGQARAMKAGASLAVKIRILKGRRLRNAATALKKAAAKEEAVHRAAYLRERAVGLLRWYLREKLYESRYRKRSAQALLHTLQQKIGYTPLTVVSGSKEARVVLEGYHFKEEGRGTWSKTVRPGQYQVTVFYKKSGRFSNKRFQVVPGQAQVITFTPPAPGERGSRRRVAVQRPVERRLLPRRKVPPRTSPGLAPWIVLGTGAALLVVGGVLLGVGQGMNDEKARIHAKTLTPSLEDTQRIYQLHQETAALFPTGWVFVGVGGAAAIAGGLWLLLAQPPS